MTLKVQIARSENGNLCVTYDGWYGLFEFDYRKDDYDKGSWCFWLFGSRPTNSFEAERSDFPLQYFLDACKASYFIRFGELPTEVEITEGEKLINN